LIIKGKQLLEPDLSSLLRFQKLSTAPKENNIVTTVALYKTIRVDSYTSADEDSDSQQLTE